MPVAPAGRTKRDHRGKPVGRRVPVACETVYRIPEKFNAKVFVGATLATVTFGPHKVDLTFDSSEPLWIAVEGTYVHAGPEQEGWADEARPPVGKSRLMQLTSHVVVAAARLDSERLRFVFDHGHVLTLVDNCDLYESFQIEASGHLWVI